MREIDTYEINPSTDTGFRETREAIVERKIEDITTQIASNMRVNLDPEIANSTEKSLDKDPLSLDVLARYFGNIEVTSQEKAPIGIYPYGEFNYRNISIQELNEDFTPEKLVSTLLWSSAMLKLPVETYKSSMDLQNFKVTPKVKEEILRYILKEDNKEVSDTIKVVSKQPLENITEEDIEYLVEARRKRGGITKEEVDKEANRVREQIAPLLLENKWENLSPEVLSHVLSINAQKETVELGDLISEVYPAFERYREDINEALKLAFIDREKFVKKYVENDTVRERINRVFSDLRRKLPNLNYKTATALSGMVLIVAACSPIVSSTTGKEEPVAVVESSEISEQTEPTPIVETYTPVPTETEEPTPTPTETQEPSPTPTEIHEPTATPTRIPTSEDYWVRGYMLDIAFSPEEGWSTSLFVEEANIEDYYVDGEEVVLDVDMLIYEKRMKEELRAKSFDFVIYDEKTRSFSKPEVITTEEFSKLQELIGNSGPNTKYQVEVIVEGDPEFSDDFVVDYVSGYIEPSFKIIQIVQYEKTW